MDDSSYALAVFRQHFARYTPGGSKAGFVALELGPGDSLFSALIARSHGASRTYLVDTGRFASRDVDSYRRLATTLREAGLESIPPDFGSVDQYLERCRGTYLVDGARSLQTLPDASVDFVWSHAVLEHVRLTDFHTLLAETRRVLRTGGVASHRIDLTDHMGGALNNLRFTESAWESALMARSGFYTNRIRFGQMCQHFRDAGFKIAHSKVETWRALPIPKRAMASPFRDLDDQELLVRAFDVVLVPA
jgi:hypothetical protein